MVGPRGKRRRWGGRGKNRPRRESGRCSLGGGRTPGVVSGAAHNGQTSRRRRLSTLTVRPPSFFWRAACRSSGSCGRGRCLASSAPGSLRRADPVPAPDRRPAAGDIVAPRAARASSISLRAAMSSPAVVGGSDTIRGGAGNAMMRGQVPKLPRGGRCRGRRSGGRFRHDDLTGGDGRRQRHHPRSREEEGRAPGTLRDVRSS